MESGLTVSMPRLRLPHKPHQRHAAPSLVPASEIPDLPTRPASPTSSMARRSWPRSLRLHAGVGWNSGIVRQHAPNEDSVLALQGMCTYHGRLVPFGLFVVADGIGGQAYGQEASRIAIQSMMQMVLQHITSSNTLNETYLSEILVGGVEWANRAIYQRAQEWGQEMGTTLTAALVVGTTAYVVNVGDSRTYLCRAGTGLAQITRDHSLVATLVAFGEIRREEMYTHPERHKVYRSLGHSEDVDVDLFLVDLRRDDRLLLCSDGLWEMVRDGDIERVLWRSHDPERMSEMLVHAALHGGSDDNVSAVVVLVE